MTPLIDLVFLLLVFFLLTASFLDPLNLQVDLPELTQGTAGEGSRLDLLIDPAGKIYLNGIEVDGRSLVECLRKRMDAGGRKEVVIRGDEKAPFGVAVRVLESVSAAGAEAIFVAGKRKTERRQGDE